MFKSTKFAVAGATVLVALAACSASTSPVPSTPGGSITVTAVPVAPKSSQTVSQGQAVVSAKSYVSALGTLSQSGMVKQLEFGGFSAADATYGAANDGANYTTAADNDATAYMQLGGFSAKSLTAQLAFDGFTAKQAAAGVASVGL